MWPFTRSMATRTRPKTLSASRRKRRPALECLEEKQLLSITFGADSTGTYAYDSNAQSRREIVTVIPVAMHEGADGTLFVSYANEGTFRYDYGSGSFTWLKGWVANVMSAAPDNSLYASFSGLGTWEFNGGSWTELASHDAYNLAAVNSGWVYASFGGTRTGTWSDGGGSWKQIASRIPIAMDASPDGTLYASFSDGTYEDNGTWKMINPDVANAIAAYGANLAVASYADGTYYYTFGQTIEITPEVTSQLGHSVTTLIGSWDSDGTYTLDTLGQTWQYVGEESYLVA